MVRTIEANIAMRPLDSMSIGTNLGRSEPADAKGAHTAGKGVGFDTFRVEPPANRADQFSPRLEIQMLWGMDIAARFSWHRNFHFSNDALVRGFLSEWCARDAR